ncbi:alpha/beta-hydrolase [Agrocybe pediades]|nr:alpha/beta-hydrolase [Agrocybe pediades]
MTTIQIRDGLHFFYTDSGEPAVKAESSAAYRTFIIIHGHSFHSGTFQRLFPLASSRNVRIICINRRGYPGSTPYTNDEDRIITSGTDEERCDFLHRQGADLATFVHRIIQQQDLSKEGGITLVGWSMGNIFLLATIVALVGHVDAEVKSNLLKFIKSVVLWDPPIEALGIPKLREAAIPLWDPKSPPEDRRKFFIEWAASYFQHGDLSTHDTTQLNFRTPDASKPPTITTMTPGELSSAVDFTATGGLDTAILGNNFASTLNHQMRKALFDPVITQEVWMRTPLYHLYGDACPWTIIHAAWVVRDEVREMKAPLKEVVIEGANHFPMWDIPEVALDTLCRCL